MSFLKIILQQLLFISLACRHSSTAQHHVNVTAGSSVDFQCETDRPSISHWKFEDIILYVNKIQLHPKFEDSVSLSDEYSLIIDYVELDHEGTYTCYITNDTAVTYKLVVIGLYD